MADKLCVTLTHARTDANRAVDAFGVANAALRGDNETLVFCSTDGVWAAVAGEAEKIGGGKTEQRLEELVGRFVGDGGRLLVCEPCMKKRGITADMLIEGAQPAVGATLVEWVADARTRLAY